MSRLDSIRGRNLLAGQWLPANDGFESRSPGDHREVVGVFPASGNAAADEAVAAARAAYPGWRRTSRILRRSIGSGGLPPGFGWLDMPSY